VLGARPRLEEQTLATLWGAVNASLRTEVHVPSYLLSIFGIMYSPFAWTGSY
jgi:hypothetical protein